MQQPDDEMTLTIEKNVIAEERLEELLQILEKIFCERCGMHFKVQTVFKEPVESKSHKNSELRIQQEVDAILQNAVLGIPEEPKRQEQADTGSVDALDFISSRQIGEMFSAPNGKVVRRIKNQILPYCTDDERREFSLTSERSRQNKYIEVYRLSKKACGIYLDHMEKWSGMINVMTGISEMRKRMQEVFA